MNPRPSVRIAKLVQDFTGGYHVEVSGILMLYSVSLAEAQRWAERNKYILR